MRYLPTVINQNGLQMNSIFQGSEALRIQPAINIFSIAELKHCKRYHPPCHSWKHFQLGQATISRYWFGAW